MQTSSLSQNIATINVMFSLIFSLSDFLKSSPNETKRVPVALTLELTMSHTHWIMQLLVMKITILLFFSNKCKHFYNETTSILAQAANKNKPYSFTSINNCTLCIFTNDLLFVHMTTDNWGIQCSYILSHSWQGSDRWCRMMWSALLRALHRELVWLDPSKTVGSQTFICKYHAYQR